MAIHKENKVKDRKNYKLCKELDKGCMNPYCFNRGFTLEAHHIIPRGMGGDDDLGNLITMCNVCHRDIEDGYMDIIGDVLKYWLGKENFRWKKSYDRMRIIKEGKKCRK